LDRVRFWLEHPSVPSGCISSLGCNCLCHHNELWYQIALRLPQVFCKLDWSALICPWMELGW
jgi:hypothetical protein